MDEERLVRIEPLLPIARLDLRRIAAMFSLRPHLRLEHHLHSRGVRARGAEEHREIGLAEWMGVVATNLRRGESVLACVRDERDRVVAEAAETIDLCTGSVGDEMGVGTVDDGDGGAADISRLRKLAHGWSWTADAEDGELVVLAEECGGARLVEAEHRAHVRVVPREWKLVRRDAAELVTVAIVDDADRLPRACGSDEVAIEVIDDRQLGMKLGVLARHARDECLTLLQPSIRVAGELRRNLARRDELRRMQRHDDCEHGRYTHCYRVCLCFEGGC